MEIRERCARTISVRARDREKVMMTELLLQASPAAGLGAGLTASTLAISAGPAVVLVLGLVVLGWFVRQMLFRQVPLDLTLPEMRVPGDQLVRERFHPRASDLLPRSPRYL
jgi:hypothetical protein